MTTLVFIEIQDGKPTEDSLGLLQKVASRGVAPLAFICGADVKAAAAQTANTGAARVLVAEDDRFASLAPPPRAKVLASLVATHSITTFLFAGSVMATEVAASLAVQLEAGLLWNLTDILWRDGAPVGLRATHGDAMRAETIWRTPHQIGVFRPRCFAPHEAAHPAAPIASVAAPAADTSDGVDIIFTPGVAAAGSLATADVIVSGGRGIGKPENLAVIRDLAAALGGEVGVSLPLVDMGWAPRAMQVGQTGTVVRPALYIACGISGQIQHRIGVERSGTIVAVNTDSEAPIMGFCDLGVIGDVMKIVPRLTARLRQRAETKA